MLCTYPIPGFTPAARSAPVTNRLRDNPRSSPGTPHTLELVPVAVRLKERPDLPMIGRRRWLVEPSHATLGHMDMRPRLVAGVAVVATLGLLAACSAIDSIREGEQGPANAQRVSVQELKTRVEDLVASSPRVIDCGYYIDSPEAVLQAHVTSAADTTPSIAERLNVPSSQVVVTIMNGCGLQ